MKKIRYFPFGYHMVNGKIGVVKKSLATNCQESFELETFHRVRVFASERR